VKVDRVRFQSNLPDTTWPYENDLMDLSTARLTLRADGEFLKRCEGKPHVQIRFDGSPIDFSYLDSTGGSVTTVITKDQFHSNSDLLDIPLPMSALCELIPDVAQLKGGGINNPPEQWAAMLLARKEDLLFANLLLSKPPSVVFESTESITKAMEGVLKAGDSSSADLAIVCGGRAFDYLSELSQFRTKRLPPFTPFPVSIIPNTDLNGPGGCCNGQAGSLKMPSGRLMPIITNGYCDHSYGTHVFVIDRGNSFEMQFTSLEMVKGYMMESVAMSTKDVESITNILIDDNEVNIRID